MTTQLHRVEAYDLASFLQGVQDAVRAGYKLDLTRNDTYPFGSIGHYIVQMVPVKGTKGAEDVVETQGEQPKKPGRKPRGE